MPFQIFRRHQRKMLAVLAILAMLGFVLSDALPSLLGVRGSRGTGQGGPDRTVITLYGRAVRESDLGRLASERGRANFALSQLAPYFRAETFGPTSTDAMVDAYILEYEAKKVGIPATPEIAKSWIFEQARQQHEFLRLLNRQIGPFNADAVAKGLQLIFEQSFKNQMSDVDFLQGVANQIRIAKVRDLIAPPLITPLDAFDAYEAAEVRVEARYAAFRAADFLDEVGEPTDAEATLRAFYDAHKSRVADPSRDGVGFRIPRRIKVEFLTLGINAIDALKQDIRSRPLAAEIRAEEAFDEEVARAFAADQERPGPLGDLPLPAFPFADDPTGTLTPPPLAFIERHVSQLVDRRVDELLVESVDLIFEGARDAIYDEVEKIDAQGVELKTGREVAVELPSLDQTITESGKKVFELLGPAAKLPEGIGFTRVGLTRLVADPTVARTLIGPDGVTPRWNDYFTLTGLDWSSLPVRRQTLSLLESRIGLEVPPISSTSTAFPDEALARGTGLFEPHEFTDSLGRRYLAVKTLDLPEVTPPFEKANRQVILAEWKLDRARTLAKDAAEALAKKVRDDKTGSPAEALDRLAIAEGKITTTTGQRVADDPLTAFAPIEASEATRDAIFALSTTGERRAGVAPDRTEDTYYVLALAAKRDRSLPPSAPPGETVNYENALNSLTFYRRPVDRETTEQVADSVMEYLREQAGVPPDWTPPEPMSGDG
jgi:hypothetical protein